MSVVLMLQGEDFYFFLLYSVEISTRLMHFVALAV